MSRKVINVVTGKGVVDKNILKIRISQTELTTPITEENFADFFWITYSEYIALRQTIDDFRINLQEINDGAVIYDILFYPSMYYKTNNPNGSIYDILAPAKNENANFIESIIIQSNEDLSFKSVEINSIQ